jgi:hypothetical protein
MEKCPVDEPALRDVTDRHASFHGRNGIPSKLLPVTPGIVNHGLISASPAGKKSSHTTQTVESSVIRRPRGRDSE